MSLSIIGPTGRAFGGAMALFSLSVGWPLIFNQGKKTPATPTSTVMGDQVFSRRCAVCHGPQGQGGAGYGKPLVGSLSVAQLAKFIGQSMPPGPVKCPAPEATKVAEYIYSAFYSPLAQEKNRPAHLTLSRLTVRQFKNAVADLIGDFRPVIPVGSPHGLVGEYFRGRDMSANGRVINRTDPVVQFDFWADGPEAGKFDPHTFSAVWQGSVYAPDTGEYEFTIRCDQSARLWVNGGAAPLVDAWVKSGTGTEFSETISLIGGRAYPLRLEFSKASQGVDDTEKKKGKPAPKASIALLWRRPHLSIETVPTRWLFTTWVPPTYVVSTAFPPDDRSVGYERGNAVSRAWDDSVTSAALDAAEFVSKNLPALTGIRDDAPDRVTRLKGTCRTFIERAFRRPITKEVEEMYINRQFVVAKSPETAIKRVVLFVLKSPRFLYREVDANPSDSYNIASKLAFDLWDTIPDSELERAASLGQLVTREQISSQAVRMAKDPRAWTKLREFLLRWVKVDEVPEIVKDSKRFPDFDASVATDLRTSFELYLENTAWSKTSDFRELMLTPTEYLNGHLAKLYGANLDPNAAFQPVTIDRGERFGLLTQPYLLSKFAYLQTSSPIHRGVLIVRNMLGKTLNPPPAAFAPLAASLHPDLTTRERVALQTKPAMCNACHGIINPLGFALERYDAVGRLRDTENGKQVDAAGFYRARNGDLVKFSGASDLAHYLANSDETHAAFVEKLFQHMTKEPVLAYGPTLLESLKKSFSENQFSIRDLMAEIATEATYRPIESKGKRS